MENKKEFKERKLTFREETARMFVIFRGMEPEVAFSKTDEFIKEMKRQRSLRKQKINK